VPAMTPPPLLLLLPSQVTIEPGRLSVGLKWYGRVVDGPLHRRIKASEAQWCMEDNEVRCAYYFYATLQDVAARCYSW
jgi:hypothetical protein